MKIYLSLLRNLGLSVAFMGTCSVASAQTVINGNFENSVTLTSGSFGYNTTGATWVFESQTGISAANGPFAPAGGASGQFAFMQDVNGGLAKFYQDIVFSSGGSFTLSYLEATRAGYGAIPSYTVSLINTANSTVAFSMVEGTSDPQNFTSVAINFSVPSDGTYRLMFAGGGTSNGNAGFDSVAITSAIPEPAVSAAWFGALSLVGVVISRRTRVRIK